MTDVFKNDPWQHEDKHRGRFNLVISEHANGINLAMATFYWVENCTLGSLDQAPISMYLLLSEKSVT